jgi:hypothetical protein
MVAAAPFRTRRATVDARRPRVAPPSDRVNPLPLVSAADVPSESAGPVGEVGRASERGAMMSDPNPTDPSAADELDEAVDAAEQHQRAEEDADADEHVVVRDPDTGHVAEEPAQ